jgi:hypothetical protein
MLARKEMIHLQPGIRVGAAHEAAAENGDA